jgi:ribosomal protein S18 acetylase RimI-like enzyme
MFVIRDYLHKTDWNQICKIHDNARKIELEGSASQDAFIPLKDCYKDEELFDSTIYVGEFNDITTGFVAFDKNEITWLYVDPLYFRKGFGRKLLEFALKNTKKPARVTVLNNNFRAIDLYKSLGFEVVEEKKGKIPLTNIEAIGLKMEQTS